MDWGAGDYERTAAQIAPVAHAAVEAAEVGPGDRLLDVACGTGNVALEASMLGARVAGLDAAARLVGVARERIPDGEFVCGDARELPWRDASFEAAVSVFGVMFAPESERVAAELCRVVKPRGRVVVTSWVPRGAIADVARVVFGDAPLPADDRIDWRDERAIRELFAPRAVEITERGMTFAAPSVEAQVDEWLDHHPVWVAGGEAVRAKRDVMIAELEAGNEATGGTGAFRTTSPYLLTVVTV